MADKQAYVDKTALLLKMAHKLASRCLAKLMRNILYTPLLRGSKRSQLTSH
jgi:hypothetical protein